MTGLKHFFSSLASRVDLIDSLNSCERMWPPSSSTRLKSQKKWGTLTREAVRQRIVNIALYLVSVWGGGEASPRKFYRPAHVQTRLLTAGNSFTRKVPQRFSGNDQDSEDLSLQDKGINLFSWHLNHIEKIQSETSNEINSRWFECKFCLFSDI